MSHHNGGQTNTLPAPVHILKALFSQAIALLLVLQLSQRGALPAQPLILATAQGIAAALLATLLRSAPWWRVIHLTFAPALVMMLSFHLPSWLYLLAFTLLLLVYWNSLRGQVPLYLSNQRTVQCLADWLPQDNPLKVLDVGSGTGSFARVLAQLRPHWQIVGIENAPAPYWLSCLLGRRLRNLHLKRDDFWQHDLGDYDVVYAFLSPVPMPALWGKACSEMRSGALLVSNSFVILGQNADAQLDVQDRRGTQLYCYRIPNRLRDGERQ